MTKGLINDKSKSLVKGISKVVRNVEGKADYNLQSIKLDEIKFNEKNKFGIREIDELAESLEKFGQLHNIVIRKIDENESKYKYELISGERRCRAATQLGWEKMAAMIVDVDDLEAESMLIIANLDTRELTNVEKGENAKRLTEIVMEQRKSGEHKGKKTREVVAEKLGVSPATAQKYITVNELIPELKDLLNKEELTLELGNQYAQLDENTQKLIFETIQEGMKLNAKQAKELKEEIKKKESDKNEVQKLLNETKERYKNTETKLKEAQQELESYEEKSQELNANIDKLEQEKEKKVSDLNNEVQRIKKEMEETLRSEITEESEEKVAELEKQLQLKTAKVYEITNEKEKEIETLKNNLSKVDRELKEKQESNANKIEIEQKNAKLEILLQNVSQELYRIRLLKTGLEKNDINTKVQNEIEKIKKTYEECDL